MSKIPSDDVQQSLYKLRIRESEQRKTVLELYDMEIHQKISVPNYQKLKTMAKRSIDQKLRLRNFDVRQGKIETGAVVKSQLGLCGKGFCYRWKEKGQCSKGDQCSFRHENNDRAPKPTPKGALPSEPSMTRGRSESRKRSVRGRSQTDRILRQPCRYYLKGTCTRSPCKYWHPPECQCYKTESGCKAGDRCLFPHYKVEEQPRRSQKRALALKTEKATTKRRWLLWKLHHSCDVSRKTQSRHDFKKAWSTGETRGTKLWDQLKEYDSHSLRSVKQLSEKIKEHRLEKYNSKFLISEVPTLWNLRTSQEETERQQRCARSRAWSLAKNINKIKEKEKATFYSSFEEWIMPAASLIKSEDREFAVDSGASMHMVSKRDLNSAELETMRISKNPTTVMTANGEVQTREEATVYVKEFDLFVTVMLLEGTPAVLSLGKLCDDHGNTYHWTSDQNSKLTQKGKNISCNIWNYVPFVVPGLSTSSSTSSSPTSSISSSQEKVVRTENPAVARSAIMSEESPWISRTRKHK